MIIRMTLELCHVDSAVDSGVTEAVVPMHIYSKMDANYSDANFSDAFISDAYQWDD